MNKEWKLSPWKPWTPVFCLRTHVYTRAHTHTLRFQRPQVIYVTVNESDELHVQSLLQAPCLYVHMALGVNLIPTAAVVLEGPGVKQRWQGPAEVLELVMPY